MIAPANPKSQYDHDAVNQQYEQMLPRIRLMALRAFGDRNYELRHEMAAEVVARAYAAFVRLAQQGRGDICYAVPLALFSIKQVRSGRRMGRSSMRDVNSPHAQLNKGISVRRLDHYDEKNAAWQEIVVEDKRSGPAEIAATRIDFAAWLKSLDRRERRIAKVLAMGETTNAAAKKFGVSASRISQFRKALRRAWLLFQGELPKPVAQRDPSVSAINRSLAVMGEAV
jgi:hypothetical protein